MKIKIMLPLIACLISLSGCNPSNSSTSSGNNPSFETKELIYASSKGNNQNSGTKESPYDVLTAMNRVSKGGKIILLEGTYSYTSTLQVLRDVEKNNGTLAYSKEEEKLMEPEKREDGSYVDVTFDFSSMAYSSSNRGISLDSDYWHIKGFTVKGAGDNGVYIGGNYNTVELIKAHDNRDTGIQLGRSASSYTDISQWPSYNTILNCTSFDNHDPTGEDSDGFACKLTTGVGNVFDGCIAYNNVDDGWDLYAKGESGPIGPVTLKNCIAFNNGITTSGIGTSNSDGNGFKLGGESIAVSHIVENCIAFNNLASGFTDNSNPGTLSFTNCTSFNNGTRDFDGINFSTCRDKTTSINVYKNCLSYSEGELVNPITGEIKVANSNDEYMGTASYSMFYSGLSNFYIGEIQKADYSSSYRGVLYDLENPFISTKTMQMQAKMGEEASEITDVHKEFRKEDGSITLKDFLKLKDDSICKTLGENSTPLGAIFD